MFNKPDKKMSVRNYQKLMTAASNKINLTDFGDQRFINGLLILTESVAQDPRISPIGRMIIKKSILEYLTNRLLITESLRITPEILNTKIQQPLFIVGLSRTGTTLLHNLLALAPGARAPRTWELLYPAPSPIPNSQDEINLIRRVKRKLLFLHLAAPRLKVIHPIKSTDIEECYPLINHTFTSPAFVFHYGIHQYADWLSRQDFNTECWIYNEYKSQLQILQHNNLRCRWVLKSAVHLYYLNALWNEFPDALIVQTHRDPLKMIPSLCSMIKCFRNIIYKKVRSKDLGQECLNLLHKVISRGSKARYEQSDKKIIDVHFDELIRDPIGQVRKIHDYFNLEWDSLHGERMQKWLVMNPPNNNGIHRYSLSEFNLNEDRINSLFSDYSEI
jgi:hypothetical protein